MLTVQENQQKKSSTELRDPPLLLWKVFGPDIFFVRRTYIRFARTLWISFEWLVTMKDASLPRWTFLTNQFHFSSTVNPSYRGRLVYFCFGIAISCCQAIFRTYLFPEPHVPLGTPCGMKQQAHSSRYTNHWGRLAAFTSGDCPMCFQELFLYSALCT